MNPLCQADCHMKPLTIWMKPETIGLTMDIRHETARDFWFYEKKRLYARVGSRPVRSIIPAMTLVNEGCR